MNYKVGQRLDGVINNVTDLGIFVTLPKHKSGLVHRNDFGSDWPRERQHCLHAASSTISNWLP